MNPLLCQTILVFCGLSCWQVGFGEQCWHALACRVLNLADCRGLGGESLRAVLCGSKNLGQLEGLTLDGIAEVDDQLITEVCLALPQLSRLSIKFCSLVSDEGNPFRTAILSFRYPRGD